MPYEFICTKCPSSPGSLWAHDDDVKKLEALIIFHYGQHGETLTHEQAREKIMVLSPLERLEKAIQ